MLSIAIVEDDNRFCKLLTKMLTRYGFNIISTFTNGKEFIEYINEVDSYPDISILDLELPDCSGVDIVREIEGYLKYFPVLILTSFSDENKVFEAIKEGASGYILKRDLTKKLKDSIMDVYNGGVVIEPILANRFLNYFKTFKTPKKTTVELTDEERDILTFLLKGFTYKEIAGFTNRTPRNIKYVLSQIYKKLNVKSRVQAVSEAVKLGLVDI